MSSPFPRAQIILNYENFYGEDPPEDRISLIKHVSRKSILYEIAALNYRLKPKNRIYADTSFETQVKELEYFTKTEEVFRKYARVAGQYTKNRSEYPLILTRETCVYALEELLNSHQVQEIEGFQMARIEVWESILKYLLAVNHALTNIRKEEDKSKITLETLNPKLLPLNELTVETDQIFTPYRGYWLVQHFLNSQAYSKAFKTYFETTYGLEPENFIIQLLGMYISNENENPEHDFHYQVPEGDERLFKYLSIRFANDEPLKLIGIRKSPFINVGERRYVVADNSFLIEKGYSQLVNDFWFDHVRKLPSTKKNPTGAIKQYRGEFGYFFEGYLSRVLDFCLENYKNAVFLKFDELKVTSGKGDVEIADIFFRYNGHVLLGEVKAGAIYDNEKYGGDVEALYKKSRNGFFKNFGVNQLVRSIKELEHHIENLDPKFPIGKVYQVFPCIVVNDKALQTPLMGHLFNLRFQELMEDFGNRKVSVKPLTLIHISDLERLQNYLHNKPKEIWNLLKENYKQKAFIPPFYATVNRVAKPGDYPPQVMEVLQKLINKYYGSVSD